MRHFIIFILFTILSGCVSANIDPIKEEAFFPVQYTFEKSYEQVWQATILALSEEEVIKTISRETGLIVTEYGTIEDREIGIIGTVFLGKTYKYSFTINMLEKGPAATLVSVQTNLKGTQVAIYEREEKIPRIESYMRRNLFYRICNQLFPGQNQKCNFLLSENLQPAATEPSPVRVTTTPQPPVKDFPVQSNPQVVGKKTDAAILQVQQQLTKKGYHPGPADGLIGSKTIKAIKQFQRDSKIEVTGAADQNTLMALGLKDGAKIQPLQENSRKTAFQKINVPPLNLEKTGDNKVSKEPETTETPEETTVIGKGKVTETTSLLSEDSFMAETIKKISMGQLIELLEKKNDFYKVRYQGIVGYIYAEFVVQL